MGRVFEVSVEMMLFFVFFVDFGLVVFYDLEIINGKRSLFCRNGSFWRRSCDSFFSREAMVNVCFRGF